MSAASALRRSAFERLDALLANLCPGAEPLAWHLGELRTPGAADGLVADSIAAALADHGGWIRYPPLGGTLALRTALAGWLSRRFDLDPDVVGLETEPAPGAKQAVAALLTIALEHASGRVGEPPVVVLPSPFYPTYLAASRAAQVRYYRSGNLNGLLDLLASLPIAPAAVVLCHPTPEGVALGPRSLRAVVAAIAAPTLLLVDESYVDLWVDRPVPGVLSPGAGGRSDAGPIAVVHSLSKRSGYPGLRSAAVTGDPVTVRRYAWHNRACGVSSAAPVCAAAAALWGDEEHVRVRRRALAEQRVVVERVLGPLGGEPPAVGFFRWLPVGDDEAAARALWTQAGIRAMPGRYLSAPLSDGTDPGVGRLRLTPTHPDRTVLEDRLARARTVLAGSAPARVSDRTTGGERR